MSVEKYWMGKNIDFQELLDDYHRGLEYIEKVNKTESSLLKINFNIPEINQPVFAHELIYKTIKGSFHDFKSYCLDQSEYNKSTPIFLYEIK